MSVVHKKLHFNQALHDFEENGGVVDRSIISSVKPCGFLMYEAYDGRFPQGGNMPHCIGSLNMSARTTEPSPPSSAKVAEGNKLVVHLFFGNGAICFGKKETVENVSDVSHGGRQVGKLLAVDGDVATNLPNALAVSQGFSG